MMLGEDAGYWGPVPLSPEEAVYRVPWRVKVESKLVSEENSTPPQLMDTSVAPRRLAAATAEVRSSKLALAASTRTILAPGASAWAHSMSSDSSSAQPASTGGVPCGSRREKHVLVVHVGRP